LDTNDAMPAAVHAASEAISPATELDDAADETPASGREIDLPISNAQRRAMRSSARKPARSKPKADVPAAAIAVAQPVAEAVAPAQPADVVDAADAPQKRSGARSGRGRKPKAGANVE
jgi:hypothetical protein